MAYHFKNLRMKKHLKYYLKKNVPARWLELFSYKAVTITKIPPPDAVISDLFVLRVEDGWETIFECLQFETLLNPSKKVNIKDIIFSFYTNKGQLITERKVILPKEIKTTINVNQLVEDLTLKEDGLFAIFHPQKKNWIRHYDSFLAERGYIGYANSRLGAIKGYVHGNLDAIARSDYIRKDLLLGNYSFFNKEYRLQHSFEPGNSYELYLVNPTSTKQRLNLVQKTNKKEDRIIVDLPPMGLYKYVKTVDKNEDTTFIIIESKLYLARPVVFKIMPSSFDVFHG